MLIGIDLLWVRPNICGGTESVIRNLMTGFGMYDDKNEYVLFVGRDVADTFGYYEDYPNMKLYVCNTDSLKRIKRIAWENTNLDKTARSLKIDLMFIPVYSKPESRGTDKGGIPYITVIHDLQALHFPEYFSKPKIFFAKRSWKKACNESAGVITISGFCREDIIKNYPAAKDKVSVIYDPILLDAPETENCVRGGFDELEKKYGIKKDGYFYTVSSMLPHKNLDTLILTMKQIKESETDLSDFRLVVSGVGGRKQEFEAKVREAGVENIVVDTGFVSNEERDALYENCSLFLFPSTFEGFGMPPVEALMKGARVVTTRCTSLEEITRGKAVYVNDPKDTGEWIRRIREALGTERKKYTFEEYGLKKITEEYMEAFDKYVKYFR